MEPEKENGQNRRGVFQADAKTKDDRASTRKIISPVVYRYYGRKKSRTHASGSVPFILLGPNVDHWKVTSQELAKRGFNVIAVGPRDEESAIRHAERREEGPDLILQLMEALKWNKVVLVGCDTESTLAIQAAMELSPDRVVGLILCGQLESAENVFDPHHRNVHGKFALDHFLHGVLRCPFTVVWGGDGAQSAPSTKPSEGHSTADPAEDHRYLVIGGGSAPHRRRPELFAWILTRFVEKKIAPAIDVKGGTQRRYIGNRKRSTTGQGPVIDLPWHIQDIFNEESFIVFGRVAATALFYIMAVKVLFYQYDNFVLTVGMVSSARQRAFKTMQSAWDSLLLAKQNVFASISHLFALLGSPLFYFRKSRTMEQAEEQSKESVPTEHKEISDEPEDDRTQDKEEGDEDDVETEEVRPSSFLDHVIA
jgi:pimeloyl-ACP methyl ester carboxylesterase